MYEYQRILQQSNRQSSSENDQNVAMQADSRKSNKPLLEKKRRARINRSLEQLKALLIDAIKTDHPTGYSKLEKADILELAVKYLRNIRTQQQLPGVSVVDAKVVTARYHAGFSECATEVDRYLSSLNGLTPDTRGKLMTHLAACVGLPPAAASSSSGAVPRGPMPLQPLAPFACPTPSASGLQTRQNPQSAMLRMPKFAMTPITTMSFDCGPNASPEMHQGHVTTQASFRPSPECWSPIFSPVEDESCPSNGSPMYSPTSGCLDMTTTFDDAMNDSKIVSSTCNSGSGRCTTRPLAEINNNIENISRNNGRMSYQQQQQRLLLAVEEGHGLKGQHFDLATVTTSTHIDNDQENAHDLMDDSIKDEPVWRPW